MRKIFLFIAALVCASTMNATEGALSGKFSVSATKQVVFSQGNLQYQASTDTWRFAEQQWEYVGGKNTGVVYENGEKCSNKLISDTYTGWIDLFGWGTGNAPTKYTGTNDDYTTFTDWGINKISNGGNADSLWRTLTADEWNYLIRERTNADSLFTYATVNGKVGTTDVYIQGVLLLPDDWVTPDGLTVKRLLAAGNDVSWKTTTISAWYDAEGYEIKVNEPFTLNSYSDSQWQQLEAAGAVFLPKTFYRDSTTVQDLNISGHYWSTTQRPDYMYDALALNFTKTGLSPRGTLSLHFGGAVRLVQDYEVTPNVFTDGTLPGKFAVNADGDSIQFATGNLQYNKYEAWWQFAENQYDILGGANKYISDIDDADHQVIDLFGWGTSGYNGKSPTMTSTTNTDYGDGATNDIAGTPYDWAVTAAEDMSLDGNWRTLTVDEWHYIVNTRPNAAQLKAKATVAGQTGLILLPDNWDLTSYPLNTTDDYTANVFTQVQWIVWEAQGAVFLPCAGYRAGTDYRKQSNEADFGAYWSSSNAVFTEDNPNYGQAAMVLFIDWSSVAGLSSGRRSRGYAVRLAREVKPIAYHNIILPELEHGYVTVFDVLSGHMLSEAERDSIPDGTILSVRAVPDEGYSFDKWNAPWSAHYTSQEIYPFEVGLIPGDYTFAPTFKAGEYTVAVTANPTEACQITCTTTGADLSAVPYNTQLTFALETAAGYKLRGVAGNSECIATLNETTLILKVTKNITLSLVFEHVSQGIEEPTSDSSLKGRAHKFLRDGQLLIEKNGKTYNVLGDRIQ